MTTRKTLRKVLLISAVLLPIFASGTAHAIGGNNAPCDGIYDCFATAWWYAFYR